jgi:hypothetical protein
LGGAGAPRINHKKFGAVAHTLQDVMKKDGMCFPGV